MTVAGGAPFSSHVHLAEARSSDVPDHDAWLGPSERGVLAGLRFTKRRSDWRLGRWVAKRAVTSALGGLAVRPEDLEILAAEGGAPWVRVPATFSRPRPRVSISHAQGVGFSVATLETLFIGCDVEEVAARTDHFVSDYLTESEQATVATNPGLRDVLVNLAWSAKESALKALGEGLRRDTRTVEVSLVPPGTEWRPLDVRAPGLRLSAWCRAADGFVWSVAMAVPPDR